MISVHMYYVHQRDVGLPSYMSNNPSPRFCCTDLDFNVVFMADEAAVQVQCLTTV